VEWYNLGLTKLIQESHNPKYIKVGQQVQAEEWSTEWWLLMTTETKKSLKRNYLVQIHLHQICLKIITHLRRLLKSFHMYNLVARTWFNTETKSLR
jgi:hypothetical protein